MGGVFISQKLDDVITQSSPPPELVYQYHCLKVSQKSINPSEKPHSIIL